MPQNLRLRAGFLYGSHSGVQKVGRRGSRRRGQRFHHLNGTSNDLSTQLGQGCVEYLGNRLFNNVLDFSRTWHSLAAIIRRTQAISTSEITEVLATSILVVTDPKIRFRASADSAKHTRSYSTTSLACISS